MSGIDPQPTFVSDAEGTLNAFQFSVIALSLVGLSACQQGNDPEATAQILPDEVIDLGALVTRDLPERIWGQALLSDNGWYERQNEFEVMTWRQELPGGAVSGSNSYYTIFNHGGPHVDAPNHVGLPGGLDAYPVDAFVGPVRIFDISAFPLGRSVDVSFFEGADIQAGDIVLLYTAYTPPRAEDEYPEVVTLTRSAAEYLASIPVKAIGTDAMSLESLLDETPVEADTALGLAAPIHESFLSRSIPIYEQLFNVDSLLGKSNMVFVGTPLNIEDGDGMIVRPVVLVY